MKSKKQILRRVNGLHLNDGATRPSSWDERRARQNRRLTSSPSKASGLRDLLSSQVCSAGCRMKPSQQVSPSPLDRGRWQRSHRSWPQHARHIARSHLSSLHIVCVYSSQPCTHFAIFTESNLAEYCRARVVIIHGNARNNSDGSTHRLLEELINISSQLTLWREYEASMDGEQWERCLCGWPQKERWDVEVSNFGRSHHRQVYKLV